MPTFLAAVILAAVYLVAALHFLGFFACFGVFFEDFAFFEDFGDGAAFFTDDFLVDADFLPWGSWVGNLNDPLAPKFLPNA